VSSRAEVRIDTPGKPAEGWTAAKQRIVTTFLENAGADAQAKLPGALRLES
jgi:hypothetical protein